MNQLAVRDTRANFELAKAFADAKMVPDHFKKSVGDCYIAVNLAERYHMDPWTLMQELYIIQGKPMMSGKLATAILNNSLADPLRPEYSGEGDDRTIVLTGRPEGEAAPLSVTLKVKDAKTQNEQWRKAPDQMLMYAASRMWGRRYTPDILLGIVFDDEAPSLVPSQVPARPGVAIAGGTVDAPPSRAAGQYLDTQTGEVFENPVAVPKYETDKWYDWGARFVACTRLSRDIDTVDQWIAENAEMLEFC